MGLDPIRKFTLITGKWNGTSHVPYYTIAFSDWVMAKGTRIELACQDIFQSKQFRYYQFRTGGSQSRTPDNP